MVAGDQRALTLLFCGNYSRNPVQRITHECEVVNGKGMRVLPRRLPAALPKTAFSGYHGLISRAPERRAPEGPAPPGKED